MAGEDETMLLERSKIKYDLLIASSLPRERSIEVPHFLQLHPSETLYLVFSLGKELEHGRPHVVVRAQEVVVYLFFFIFLVLTICL